ncbi:PepSY domain-containing protein [Streptomyces sp. NPDC059063]|uniref:PepSY domain-containing protein n=1 Tax=unclassified Streptomyces TaxID=2593676 RepID=UPI0036CA9FE0
MKRNIAIAGIAALALAAGGTTVALAAGGDDEPSKAGAKSSVRVQDDDRRGTVLRDDDAAENSAEVKAAEVSAADAISAALKSASGTVVSADLDDEDGGLVWDVDVLGKDGRTWHSVQVDPGTGKVLGSYVERDDDEDDARVAGLLKGASVSASDAVKAVSGKGTVTSVDVDDDSGVGAWDVETVSGAGAESHWNVDVRSGKVTAGPLDD